MSRSTTTQQTCYMCLCPNVPRVEQFMHNSTNTTALPTSCASSHGLGAYFILVGGRKEQAFSRAASSPPCCYQSMKQEDFSIQTDKNSLEHISFFRKIYPILAPQCRLLHFLVSHIPFMCACVLYYFLSFVDCWLDQQVDDGAASLEEKTKVRIERPILLFEVLWLQWVVVKLDAQ